MFERPTGSASGDFGARMGKFVLAYASLIIYVSLLPLALSPTSIRRAWLNFSDMPFLALNFSGRIEAIPSLVFYLPLGFLMGAWLLGLSRRVIVLVVGVALSLVFCTAIACGVEFFQQFFPPRFMSLNDIYAEVGGGAVGVGLWLLLGPWFYGLAKRIASWRFVTASPVRATDKFARHLIVALTLPYFLGIAWLNGWFSDSWQSLSLAITRISAVPVLPLYYQSNFEVPAVLINVIFQMVLYWPVATAVWFWQRGLNRGARGVVSPAWTAVFTTLIALVIELGKLFHMTRLPNLSNVLAALVIALCVHWLLERWFPNTATPRPENQPEMPRLPAPMLTAT